MRILLFLATNIAVLVLVSIVFNLLGLEGILAANGVDLNLQALLVMCAVFGFGGSLISLFLSKWMAKRGTGTYIIEQPRNRDEEWLLTTVRELADEAGIGMPEVGIFPSQAANAFATGWNRNSALVAVSAGLLQRFRPEEVRAVMAHEIGHVANGDMVTLTLIQGVVNTFVMFLARVIGHAVDRIVFKTERGYGMGYYHGGPTGAGHTGQHDRVLVLPLEGIPGRRRRCRPDHQRQHDRGAGAPAARAGPAPGPAR